MADSKGFLGALFDFGFQSFVTPKVVKMLYVLIMIGTVVSALVFTIVAFKASLTFGVATLLFGDPLVAVQAFAAAGLGVAVIPGLAIAHALPHVEVRPIRGLAPVRRIWAARPRDPFCPEAVRAMIETLQLTATSGAAVRRPQRRG